MDTQNTTDQDALLAFGRRWAEAEVAKDLDTLAAMAHPDLRLIGPLGFILDRDAWVHRYASGDLAFTPGTQWDYSHSNWLIVQAIVEQVSGKPYPKLVQDELTGPLGMAHSGIFAGDSAEVPGMAQGYSALSPAPQRRINPLPAYMAMAGGFYSTAPDLLRLLQGVFASPLLSEASRRAVSATRSSAITVRAQPMLVARWAALTPAVMPPVRSSTRRAASRAGVPRATSEKTSSQTGPESKASERNQAR